MRRGGTEAFGEFLPAWSRRRGLVRCSVTETDHSRRVKRVLRRNSPEEGPRFIIRLSQIFQAFTPDHWWQDRSTVRTGLVELQKLAVDVVVHPLSW